MASEWIATRRSVVPASAVSEESASTSSSSENNRHASASMHVHTRDGLRYYLVHPARLDSEASSRTLLDTALDALRQHRDLLLRVRTLTQYEWLTNDRDAAIRWIREQRKRRQEAEEMESIDSFGSDWDTSQQMDQMVQDQMVDHGESLEQAPSAVHRESVFRDSAETQTQSDSQATMHVM